MNTSELIAALEAEISRLQQARKLLADSGTGTEIPKRKPKLSAEARARIIAAQKKRWAKHRKANK